MAPVSDRNYFPPLEECLGGERVLLSWKLIATALTDGTGQRQTSSAVTDFFDDEYVQNLLKEPASVFAPTSSSSQAAYETKTAPINVTSASNERYDIKAVKEDTEWLSKNVNINLTTALRLVVVEFQSRASRYLMGPLSLQDATNLQEAAGLSNGQGTGLVADLGSAAARDADETWNDFEATTARKQRLFDTYLAERRFFMMVADYASSIKLYGRLPTFAPVVGNVAQMYRLKGLQTADELESLLPAYLQVLTNSMTRIESGLAAVTDDKILSSEDNEMEWIRTYLSEAVHALSIVFQVADSYENEFPPASSVNQWFSLMEVYNFFDNVHPISESIAELVIPLKTLAAAISVLLLKPARSLIYLSEREDDSNQADHAYDSFLLSSDVLEQVHTSILNAASLDSETASPAIFAWALILHRMNVSYQSRTEKRDNLLQQSARERFETSAVTRPTGRRNSAGSIFSIESSKFDGFLEHSAQPRDFQVVEQLASAVTSRGMVFDVISKMATELGPSAHGSMTPLLSSRIRTAFVELLKVSYPIVGYQSEPVSSLLSLLSSGRGYWDISPQENLSAKLDVLSCMVSDDDAMEFYFRQALERFPYEFLPLIVFCRALCSTTSLRDDDRSDLIQDLLRHTPTITFTLPDSFQSYELVHEDENTSSFRLLEDIPLVSVSPARNRSRSDEDTFRIPAGTVGRFITDNGRVVLMNYSYSFLSLIGRQLEVYLMPEAYQTGLRVLQADEIAEAVSLLAMLLRTECLKASPDSNDALVRQDDDLLHEASKSISGGKDIVNVVCETLDYFMQDGIGATEQIATGVLTSCIQFLHAVLPLQPSRIWSYMARSELLSSESTGGKLTKIVGDLDLVSENFDFLMSALRLFSRLIDTVMSSAVQRRAGNRTTNMRKPDPNPWLGTAEKVLIKVSLSIAQASMDIFENTSTWNFSSETSRLRLLETVVPILDKFLLYSYGTGDSLTSDNLVTSLRPAAGYIVDCFMSPSTGTLRFQPLLASLAAALTSPQSTLYPTRLEIQQTQLVSILRFSTTLLRTADYLEKPASMIETYLFKSSTLLARMCAVSSLFTEPAVELLTSLVANAGKSTHEPHSLLGYLGPHIAKSFLQLLSGLGRPFVLTGEVKTTWRFFSAVLRNRQQWMSNCLLTGQTPREAMKQERRKGEVSSSSVFATALVRLKTLKDLDRVEALSILDFVASAQNYWPWTVFTLQKDTTYLDGLRAFVHDLKPSNLTARSDAVRAAEEARIAAYAAETFAMQLYHSRHLGNAEKVAKELASDLDYYLRDGVELAGYNLSLHANFEKNFPAKYFGASPSCFKRTLLQPRELGKNFFYNLDRASEMLKFDPGWLGRKDNGFKAEMEFANANLSLVDAQIALFHAWEFLLLELSTCLPGNDTMVRQMLQVAQQCLDANQRMQGPGSIFQKLLSSRAGLALVLIQRLAHSPLPARDISSLLNALVGAINAVEEPFSANSISYYRTLLKGLFVTLRAYQISEGNNKAPSGTPIDQDGTTVSVSQTVLNLLDRVVGRGFRSLVSLIHDDTTTVVPEDLALLTAILQACLSLPSLEQSQTQILNIMAAHDATHAATSLFSWADRLANNGDPVYGELSILFLLELSSLPMVAEQLACDGVLGSLLSSNLAKFMRKSNISPYAEVPVAQRCYSIWTKGFLPLMLNLLTSLGATVASEVTFVLSQFPHLLRASVDGFEAPGASRTMSRSDQRYITLLATSEVHSLALLTRVLAALRINNSRDIPAVDWDAAGLLENVEFWLSTKKLLKERIMPIGERQMEWRSTRTTPIESGGSDNVLEEKVVAQLELVRDVLSEELDT